MPLYQNRDVHRAARGAERNVPARHLAVRNPEPEIETPALMPCFASPPAKAVPDPCNELFEEVDHLTSIV
jgi:hypothetical protein